MESTFYGLVRETYLSGRRLAYREHPGNVSICFLVVFPALCIYEIETLLERSLV